MSVEGSVTPASGSGDLAPVALAVEGKRLGSAGPYYSLLSPFDQEQMLGIAGVPVCL